METPALQTVTATFFGALQLNDLVLAYKSWRHDGGTCRGDGRRQLFVESFGIGLPKAPWFVALYLRRLHLLHSPI